MPAAVPAACTDPIALLYVYGMVAASYLDRCVSIFFAPVPGTLLAMYRDDLRDCRMNLTSLKISTRWKRMHRKLW
jgi:hypothetical protein